MQCASVAAQSSQSFLVTGGTGFLGFHMLPRILEIGSVRLYCRSPPEHVAPGVTVILGSLNDVPALTQAGLMRGWCFFLLGAHALAAEGCSGIFHLAGMVVHSRLFDQAEMRACNVDGTLAVLEYGPPVADDAAAHRFTGPHARQDASALCTRRPPVWWAVRSILRLWPRMRLPIAAKWSHVGPTMRARSRPRSVPWSLRSNMGSN